MIRMIRLSTTTRLIAGSVVATLVAANGSVTRASEVPYPRLAQPSESESVRVTVMPVRIKGDLPERIETEIRERIVDGLSRDGIVLDEIPQREAPPPCTDAECWKGLAQYRGSSHLVTFTVEVTEPDYKLRAELVDGSTGESIAVVDETCDLCGLEEVGAVTADMVGTIRRRILAAVKPPPVLVVDSEPPGATVLLDGEPIGTTPLELAVEEGEHQLRVEREGYRPEIQNLALVEGSRSEVDVTLSEIEVEKTGPRPLRIAGAVTLGTGLAALGGGIAMLVLHEEPIRYDCSGENRDAMDNCKWLYDTQGGGIALTVVGTLAAATGVTLLVLDAKRNPNRQLRAFISPRGFGLRARF